jgi:hypothetical protein
MKYTKQLSDKVSEVHNIPLATQKTWEHRGTIPDKYFDGDGNIIAPKGEKITESDKHRLINLYAKDELNFSEIKAIKLQVLADLVRGKSVVIYRQDYINLKAELVDLKNKFSPVARAISYDAKVNALRIFFKDLRLKPYTFAEDNAESRYTIDQLTSKKSDPDLFEIEQIIINIHLFFQAIVL